MRLKEYFTDKELTCKCGCGAMPAAEAVRKLYLLRLLYNKPIKMRSAARCLKHNASEGDSKKSKHLTIESITGMVEGIKGVAFDVDIPAEDEVLFIGLAIEAGFNGIGVKNNNFIHLDTREESAFWTY